MNTRGHRAAAAAPAIKPATRPVHDAATSPRTVLELAPGMRGQWLVTTQGSSHLWDLDTMTYTRRPRPTSISGPFPFDDQPLPITAVDYWPRVGATSLVYLADPAHPDLTEHRRRSSRIESITEIDCTTTVERSPPPHPGRTPT